ncbi:coiled-coil domain-containing protein 43 [Lingula anatina]|uniref:Coiled-coil domain-containing protein 43 n=1 Tax=Lingula anatina TaxID=7574 RepID=A0A1S3IN53_LINAN|nr:coiled-coil domain-containing protein 43 [Lingula anatina]|eukprot:XP_013399513.1 coiled-coil domain-containing protein 43 [Lingula anatina]
MAAPRDSEFHTWLEDRLLKINPDIDLGVFVDYIQGVLETETDKDEMIDGISGLLGEVVEDDVEGVCETIISKWLEHIQLKATKAEEETKLADQKLADMLEKQKISIPTVKPKTEEEKARKAAILQQYAEISDGEVTDSDEDGGDSLLVKNENLQKVGAEEKEKREKLKQQHEQKKEKDKLDREKQKQKQAERKEAEKKRTQKVEKRMR